MCVATPGQIVSIENEEQNLVHVDISGIRRPVNVSCVLENEEPIANLIGDWVLVHVGFAMSRIDEQEAKETIALLEELGELADELADLEPSQAPTN